MAAKRSSPISLLIFLIVLGVAVVVLKERWENRILKQIIQRLEADTRVAEVVVADVKKDASGRELTTIKFIEYSSDGRPLEPKFFTFSGNLIQFQSLVIRFDDMKIRNGDALKGKSAYLFWKAFRLAGKDTEEYDITALEEVPSGYRLVEEVPQAASQRFLDVAQSGSLETYKEYLDAKTDKILSVSRFEKLLWKRFWDYALNQQAAKGDDVKNAQVEAPGTKFLPGYLYTIKIEHDGGLRIDAQKLSPALTQPIEK